MAESPGSPLWPSARLESSSARREDGKPREIHLYRDETVPHAETQWATKEKAQRRRTLARRRALARIREHLIETEGEWREGLALIDSIPGDSLLEEMQWKLRDQLVAHAVQLRESDEREPWNRQAPSSTGADG